MFLGVVFLFRIDRTSMMQGFQTWAKVCEKSVLLSDANLDDGRRGGLIVSALDSGASGPGSSPGRGHCVVFLGKTLYSHSTSLHPGV